MAVRLKTRWHHPKRKRARRGGRPKTLEDRANVLAHNVWKIAFSTYQHMDREEFSFETPEQILAVLTELIAFLVQVVDRNVYGQLAEDERKTLITAVAKQLAVTVSENVSDFQPGGEPRAAFVATLNARFADYARCTFDDAGPGYSFLRYFGEKVSDAMAAADNKWVIEYVMEIEAPEMLKMINKVTGEVLGIRVGAKTI